MALGPDLAAQTPPSGGDRVQAPGEGSNPTEPKEGPMTQFNPTGEKAFIATAALEAYRSVKFGSGIEVIACTDNDADIGYTKHKVAAGDAVTVVLRNPTRLAVAEEAFAVAAPLYTVAGGYVADTDPGSGTIRFTALEAATAIGDRVEVLPITPAV